MQHKHFLNLKNNESDRDDVPRAVKWGSPKSTMSEVVIICGQLILIVRSRDLSESNNVDISSCIILTRRMH